jgi:hypothetical protein
MKVDVLDTILGISSVVIIILALIVLVVAAFLPTRNEPHFCVISSAN